MRFFNTESVLNLPLNKFLLKISVSPAITPTIKENHTANKIISFPDMATKL